MYTIFIIDMKMIYRFSSKFYYNHHGATDTKFPFSVLVRDELCFEDTFLRSLQGYCGPKGCENVMAPSHRYSNIFVAIHMQTQTHEPRCSDCVAVRAHYTDLVVSSQICVCLACQLAQSLKANLCIRTHIHAYTCTVYTKYN